MALFVPAPELPLVPRKPPRGERRAPQWGSLHPLLDLHGLTGDAARLRADVWLRARQADRVRTVVVITGRGNHSQGPPVLLGEVERLLAELRGSVVERSALLPGGGGFQVELTRPSPPPRTLADERVARRLRGSAPELVRRAEEALWELGIVATPALLDAEIQRLTREESGGKTEGEE